MTLYIAGGYVRDTLRGLKPRDRDFVLFNVSEDISGKFLSFGDESLKVKEQVGASFPVYLTDNGEEIAFARTERKIGSGYNGFEVETEGVTMEDDASRRDLTINAMFIDCDGNIYDFYKGKEDLENKILRHTTKAFAEDPVRVLRLASFRARNPEFTIAKETVEFVQTMREELKSLTPQRILKEMEKGFTGEKPYLFFDTLKDLNVLGDIFPEIEKMRKKHHTNIKYHQEDTVYNHIMLALQEGRERNLPFDEMLGVLYHDIGKIGFKDRDKNFGGHDSEEYIQKELILLFKRMSFSNQQKTIIEASAKYHHIVRFACKKLEESSSKVVKLMSKHSLFKKSQLLESVLRISEVDGNSRIVSEIPEEPLSLKESFEIFYKGVSECGIYKKVPTIILNKDIIELSREMYTIHNGHAVQEIFKSERIINKAINAGFITEDEVKEFKNGKKVNKIVGTFIQKMSEQTLLALMNLRIEKIEEIQKKLKEKYDIISV